MANVKEKQEMNKNSNSSSRKDPLLVIDDFLK